MAKDRSNRGPSPFLYGNQLQTLKRQQFGVFRGISSKNLTEKSLRLKLETQNQQAT